MLSKKIKYYLGSTGMLGYNFEKVLKNIIMIIKTSKETKDVLNLMQ